MTKQKILLVEDEASIRSMLRYAFEIKGYLIYEAANTAQATQLLQQDKPDLIILDWMLPQQTGVSFVRQIRRHTEWENIPVLMLTAKADEEHKVEALECGADDYVVKPFSPPELLARVKAILRRGPIVSDRQGVKVAGILLDDVNQRVTIDDAVVRMGPLEYRLLHFFMTNQNRVYLVKVLV